MDSAPSQSTIKFGPYVVDVHAGELRKLGVKVRLQEKPLQLLAALAEHSGQLVTREDLRRRLWSGDTFVDFETGLNTAVSKLRDALSDSAENPRYIETIPRRGYRFLSAVEIGNGHVSDVAAPAVSPSRPNPPDTRETDSQSPNSAVVTTGPVSAAISRPRAGLWLSLAVTVLVIAGTAYWLTHGHPAFSFRSRDSVLIADFENQTGDPRFNNALDTAFTVSIQQSRYANVFPRTRIDSVLTRMEKPANEPITPALGREICQRENVRGLIAASITRTGQQYALTAQLIDPQSGETVRSYTERSYGEDHILDALDVLSKEIREALGESLYQIHQANKPLPEVTTRSLSALQQYADASALWHQGKTDSAITLYKAAIDGDAGFAMAHAGLGNAYYSFIYNRQVDGQAEYEKALSLTSRTTDRERMIIQTQYALNRNHATEADQLFRAYLNRYPDDATMRFDYANLLRKNGRGTEAIEQYNETLRVMPDFAHAYVGIATAEKTRGNYPEALRAYSKAFEIEPSRLNTGNINREYGFTLVANGESDKAQQVFSALLERSEPSLRETGSRSLAFLDLYYGRYASAQKRLEQSLQELRQRNAPLSEARIHLLLAIVAEGTGDAAAQRRNLDAALEQLNAIQPKVAFGALLGDAYARAGYVDQAEKIAAVITPLGDANDHEQMSYLHLLQGDVALFRGHSGNAIELLRQSDAEKSTGLTIEALAYAYQKSGDIDHAIAAYETMASLAEPSLGWEPQQRWLVARYTLATDYESRGDKQKARDTLATLLNLWKDADPNLVTLRDAKAAYARLQ